MIRHFSAHNLGDGKDATDQKPGGHPLDQVWKDRQGSFGLQAGGGGHC
jgi:hypothetical protein